MNKKKIEKKKKRCVPECLAQNMPERILGIVMNM